MAKTIFRRIGGRIIPIRIGSEALGTNAGATRRLFSAKPEGSTHPVSLAIVDFPKGKKHAKISAMNVTQKYRKKGIASDMFEQITDFSRRAGKKFVRSSNIEHPAQVKIRSKMRSRFVIDEGGYSKRLAGAKEAAKVIQDQFKKDVISVVRGSTSTLKRRKK
jgi:predicted GNAT family acetyltransferase